VANDPRPGQRSTAVAAMSRPCDYGCERTEHTERDGWVRCPVCGREYETDGAWCPGSDVEEYES
jgi:hypothetical protein